MVQIWDVVGFDEVADLQKMPQGGHHDDEDLLRVRARSSAARRPSSGDASIAMFGNTNQPVDVMVQTGHLFAPMPDVIRDDMAFIDRLHFYLPGWEIPKMRNELFTDHYGFVVDYLAEALRELRKHNFTEIIDRHFSLGAHLNARDRKAVRKTVSGLMKILHPARRGDRRTSSRRSSSSRSKGRRRVKEQLKKMGSFEYYQTSFSYTCNETGEETLRRRARAGRPRPHLRRSARARDASTRRASAADGTVGLYRVEVSVSTGTGKLKLAGGVAGAMKESVQRAFSYLQAKKAELGIARELDTSDFHVEVDRPARQPRRGRDRRRLLRRCLLGAAARRPCSPALLVLGDMSIQGNIKPVRSLVEPLQVAMDNGAKRALIPIENKRNFLDVSADVVEHVDPIFYGDLRTAGCKGAWADLRRRHAGAATRALLDRSLQSPDRLLRRTSTQARIEAIADVRSSPWSRFAPQFNRESMRSPSRTRYRVRLPRPGAWRPT